MCINCENTNKTFLQFSRYYVIIELPSMVTVLETSYVYTAWNFMAEFGGWMGILLGFCVADVNGLLEIIDKYLRKSRYFM